MNPKQADKELTEKMTQLHDVFQQGQRAKEFVQTEYWGQIRDAILQKIKTHTDVKASVDPMVYRSGYSITKADGSTFTKSGEEILTEAIASEAEVRALSDILQMVDADLRAGQEAQKELEKYKK